MSIEESDTAVLRLGGSAQDVALANMSVAQIVRRLYPHLRIRQRVVDSQIVASVTLAEIHSSPDGIEGFLHRCRRMVPQCGDKQITLLRDVLQHELENLDGIHRDVPSPAQRLPAPGTTGLPLSGRFYPDTVTAMEDVFLRMWRLAAFSPFIYLPTSIPEFAKHPAVLRAELGPRADLPEYLEDLTSLRNGMASLQAATGIVIIDRQILGAVFGRQGRYACLGQDDLQAQKALLGDVAQLESRGVTTVVTDFEIARLSPASIVGDHLIIYGMGGYAVFSNPPTLDDIRDRCATVARVAGSLADYLCTLP